MNPVENLEVGCPYCSERLEIAVDRSGGSASYVEDCQVCCRPMILRIFLPRDGDVDITVQTLDG